MKMVSVTIRWGKYAPKDKRLVTTEEFQTQAELDAYLRGIDDMDGWTDYEVIEDDEIEGWCLECDNAGHECICEDKD